MAFHTEDREAFLRGVQWQTRVEPDLLQQRVLVVEREWFGRTLMIQHLFDPVLIEGYSGDPVAWGWRTTLGMQNQLLEMAGLL